MSPDGSSFAVQWVKDPTLLQLWHRLQLQCRFDPQSGELLHAAGAAKKNKKEKEKKLSPDIFVILACQMSPVLTFPCATELLPVGNHWDDTTC